VSRPVAIITGAGKGIGRATAIALAGKGYDLVLVARTASDLAATAKLSRGSIVQGDVTQVELADRAVAEAIKKFGRVDALVNNAGFAPVRSIEEMTIDEWRQVIDTNLSAAFYFTRAAWPIMKKQGGGAIVNISSAAARDPFKGFFAYGAAKAGVNLMGLALARDGDKENIRVHTIAPGAVETTMFRSIATEEQFPPEKTLNPADVARTIVQCICGDLQHTSGEVIYVHRRLS
jgi:NAD(P)-dependent dehydrogenase (short-subunit alcohol dehydrogenase family)